MESRQNRKLLRSQECRLNVYSFLHVHVFFFPRYNNAFLNRIAICKLMLEIIRKLQTRMSSLTIHQISKTKVAAIFNAITSTLYSVRRIRTSSNLRLSQYSLALAFHTAYSCIFHLCNFDRIAFSTPAFSVAPFLGRRL